MSTHEEERPKRQVHTTGGLDNIKKKDMMYPHDTSASPK